MVKRQGWIFKEDLEIYVSDDFGNDIKYNGKAKLKDDLIKVEWEEEE